MSKSSEEKRVLVSLAATREERRCIELIRKARKFNSNSHVIRVLILEEAEKILTNASDIGISVVQ